MSSYGTFISAAGVRSNLVKIDVVANNLSNAETGGFKRLLSSTLQLPVESKATGRPGDRRLPADLLGGVVVAGPTKLDLSQGPLAPTSNPLDVALVGDGFFAIEDARGDAHLTRDGRFTVGVNGHLTTSNGEKVLDSRGKTIHLAGLPPAELSVGNDGTVAHGGRTLATLGVFAAPAQLKPVGDNRYAIGDRGVTDLDPGPAVVRGHLLERSNVDPTTELTRMLTAQRQLEANANFIRQQDTATEKLVNVVGKVA